MRSVISRVFRYAIATARADRDLAADLRGALTAPKVKHHAAITTRKETRSEEHTSELQSLMRISYAVFCLKKKIKNKNNTPYAAKTDKPTVNETTAAKIPSDNKSHK